MKTPWFRKTGIIFIPISIVGVVLYLFTLAFCVNVFMAIDRNSHSNSDTLYGIFPFFVGAFTILFWIASNTCEEKK
jgi:drug/metabolite transporter (DMT)-like permease